MTWRLSKHLEKEYRVVWRGLVEVDDQKFRVGLTCPVLWVFLDIQGTHVKKVNEAMEVRFKGCQGRRNQELQTWKCWQRDSWRNLGAALSKDVDRPGGDENVGAARRGSTQLGLYPWWQNQEIQQDARMAVSSRKSHVGRYRKSPWLERSVLQRYWEFDRQFQKSQRKS